MIRRAALLHAEPEPSLDCVLMDDFLMAIGFSILLADRVLMDSFRTGLLSSRPPTGLHPDGSLPGGLESVWCCDGPATDGAAAHWQSVAPRRARVRKRV